uniref:Myticalin C6 n=1 Tax=Panagrellus redivivus TaxID=6233 RepID=A0A7E4ZZF1_PANRE
MMHLKVYIFIALIVVAGAVPLRKRPYRNVKSAVLHTIGDSPNPVLAVGPVMGNYQSDEDYDDDNNNDIDTNSHDGPEDEDEEELFGRR